MRMADLQGQEKNNFTAMHMTAARIEHIRRKYPEACRRMGYRVFKPMSAEEIAELDKIVLYRPVDDLILQTAKDLQARGADLSDVATPFIDQGVIIFTTEFPEEPVTSYLTFTADRSGQIYVEMYAVGEIYTHGKPRMSYRGTIYQYDDNHFAMEYECPEKIILDAYQKGRIYLQQPEVETCKEAVRQLHQQFEYTTQTATSLFRIINTLLAEDAKQKEAGTTGKPYSAIRRGDSRKGRKTRIVYLDKIAIEPGAKGKIKIKRGTVMNRHTDVWGVRGHERHYKSGKVIWIEPYEKGPERGKKKRAPKEYRIR